MPGREEEGGEEVGGGLKTERHRPQLKKKKQMFLPTSKFKFSV